MNYFLAALKNFKDFEGRSRRSEYWYFVLIANVITYAITYILGLIHLAFIGTILSVILIVPSVAVIIRRMHDVNKSGWYCLIPIYNLVLCCTNGDVGPNQYGTDPKDPAAMDEIDQIGLNK